MILRMLFLMNYIYFYFNTHITANTINIENVSMSISNIDIRAIRNIQIQEMHIEKDMSDSYANEDLFNALALLHSTDENSAEKLRRMLDACIEKKYGPGKTLAARMPRRFLQNTDNANASMRISKKRDYVQGRCVKAVKNEIWDGSGASLLGSDTTENTMNHQTTDIKVTFNYEDCSDDQNIPRISIPDEGSIDGTLCKVFFPHLKLSRSSL